MDLSHVKAQNYLSILQQKIVNRQIILRLLVEAW